MSTVKDNIAVAGLNYDRDTHGTGYKIFGGYRFTQNLGLEIGYIDFGREKFNWTFSPVERGSGDVKAQNFAISATGRLPMTASFALLGKLGVGTTHIKYNEHWSQPGYSETINVTHRSTVPVVGVGAEYTFNKNIGVRAEYEYIGKAKLDDVKVKTDLFSVGLSYHF